VKARKGNTTCAFVYTVGPYDDTIIPKRKLPNGNPVEIGQRLRLSPGDIRQANKLYSCTSKIVIT